MLKRFRLFIVFVLLLRFLIVPIQADIGPKPSVEITFENMPEGKYYVTLLTSQDSYGPWQPITEETFLEEAKSTRYLGMRLSSKLLKLSAFSP